MSLLKLQRGGLSEIFGIITGHSITGTHARRIDLGHLVNDFYRSCRYEEKIIAHLLCNTCPAFYESRSEYLVVYNIDDVEELSSIDIGSLNCFFGSTKLFLDHRITDVTQW